MASLPLPVRRIRDGKGIFFSPFRPWKGDRSSVSVSPDALDALGLIGMYGLMD